MTKLEGTACEGPEGNMNASGEPIELESVGGNLKMEPVLRVELSGSLNYASWLLLTTEPRFARPKRWVIDRISLGDRVTLRDLDLDSGYLNGLNEAERANPFLNFEENGTR